MTVPNCARSGFSSQVAHEVRSRHLTAHSSVSTHTAAVAGKELFSDQFAKHVACFTHELALPLRITTSYISYLVGRRPLTVTGQGDVVDVDLRAGVSVLLSIRIRIWLHYVSTVGFLCSLIALRSDKVIVTDDKE